MNTIAFYSTKGGIGCTTSLILLAKYLALHEKNVLIFDLNFHSPSLTLNFSNSEKGIIEYSDNITNHELLILTIKLKNAKEINFVPLFEKNNSILHISEKNIEYLNKKVKTILEHKKPDYILFDISPGLNRHSYDILFDTHGINPDLILLFCTQQDKIWERNRILFKSIQQNNLHVREKLQIVSIVHFKENTLNVFETIKTKACDVFVETLYDELPCGSIDGFNFHIDDTTAPHYPWIIRYNEQITNYNNFHELIMKTDTKDIEYIIGKLAKQVKIYFREI